MASIFDDVSQWMFDSGVPSTEGNYGNPKLSAAKDAIVDWWEKAQQPLPQVQTPETVQFGNYQATAEDKARADAALPSPVDAFINNSRFAPKLEEVVPQSTARNVQLATPATPSVESAVADMAMAAPAKQPTWFDNLNSKMDLATVGMALLASNDGSSNLVTNAGRAMLAGQAKVKEDEAIARDVINQKGRAAYMDALTRQAEATTQAIPVKAAADLLKANNALTGRTKAMYDQQVEGVVARLGAHGLDVSTPEAVEKAKMVAAAMLAQTNGNVAGMPDPLVAHIANGVEDSMIWGGGEADITKLNKVLGSFGK